MQEHLYEDRALFLRDHRLIPVVAGERTERLQVFSDGEH
jgi:hypothetical protein